MQWPSCFWYVYILLLGSLGDSSSKSLPLTYEWRAFIIHSLRSSVALALSIFYPAVSPFGKEYLCVVRLSASCFWQGFSHLVGDLPSSTCPFPPLCLQALPHPPSHLHRHRCLSLPLLFHSIPRRFSGSLPRWRRIRPICAASSRRWTCLSISYRPPS